MICEIIQADFAVTLARVAAMGGADLILTSPPYADARTYSAGVSWTMPDYQRLGDAVKPALKPGGHCLMVRHPARFCLRFAEDAVRCFCPPGGLVCDPFSGSGTSAVAAAKHGRRFFGGDLLTRPSDGKPWAQVAMERVTEATRQQNLFGAAL